MALSKPENNFYLGFAVRLNNYTIHSVERQYLPLGKVGGKPAWLNPVNLPAVDLVRCKKCSHVMPLLMQIYSPGTHGEAFHRYIYVFMCKGCNTTNDSSTMTVLRCQLQRENKFYNADSQLRFDDVGIVDDPYAADNDFAKTCLICGNFARFRCGKCNAGWYCCKEHQILDWQEGPLKHKDWCANGKYEIPEPEDDDHSQHFRYTNFTFPEHGIEMDTCCKDDSDYRAAAEVPAVEANANLEDLHIDDTAKNHGGSSKVESDDFDAPENPVDESFERFTKILDLDPQQILRYDRFGTPISATDYAQVTGKLPPCENCKGARKFEFQIMPHLLNVISAGMTPDFATIAIYTCENDCAIPDEGYTQEYAIKQDHVQPEDTDAVAANGDAGPDPED